jgi:hypothetical protein
MERTKAYRPILKGGILLSLLSIIFFLAMLYSDNFWPLLVTFGLMGVYLLIVSLAVFTHLLLFFLARLLHLAVAARDDGELRRVHLSHPRGAIHGGALRGSQCVGSRIHLRAAVLAGR